MSERPGSIHIAYVCCDADGKDAVHQCDEATVPLRAPGSINMAQDEVERDPAEQGQQCKNHWQCHHLLYWSSQAKYLKPPPSVFQKLPCKQSSSQLLSYNKRWEKNAKRHILLYNIPYSNKTQHYHPKTWTVRSFVSEQQLAFAWTIIALQLASWWSGGVRGTSLLLLWRLC